MSARGRRAKRVAARDGPSALYLCCNGFGYSRHYIRCRQVAMALSSALYLESKQNFPPARTCLALFGLARRAG